MTLFYAPSLPTLIQSNLSLYLNPAHECDPEILELLHWGRTSLRTQSEHSTLFWLRTMAPDLEVLITATTSHMYSQSIGKGTGWAPRGANFGSKVNSNYSNLEK